MLWHTAFVHRWALIAALLPGCYRPNTEASCTLQCTTSDLCPAGMSCLGGYCKS